MVGTIDCCEDRISQVPATMEGDTFDFEQLPPIRRKYARQIGRTAFFMTFFLLTSAGGRSLHPVDEIWERVAAPPYRQVF